MWGVAGQGHFHFHFSHVCVGWWGWTPASLWGGGPGGAGVSGRSLFPPLCPPPPQALRASPASCGSGAPCSGGESRGSPTLGAAGGAPPSPCCPLPRFILRLLEQEGGLPRQVPPEELGGEVGEETAVASLRAAVFRVWDRLSQDPEMDR